MIEQEFFFNLTVLAKYLKIKTETYKQNIEVNYAAWNVPCASEEKSGLFFSHYFQIIVHFSSSRFLLQTFLSIREILEQQRLPSVSY